MVLHHRMRVIRHRKWQIISLALIVAAIAASASLLQPRAYRGEATVLITRSEAGSSAGLGQLFGLPGRGMQNQIRLMQRPPVVERAIRKLGIVSTSGEFLDRTTVWADGRTDQVTVSVIDAAPGRATAAATALATSYVEWARDLARSGVASAAVEASASMTSAKAELLQLAAQTGGTDAATMTTQLSEATARQVTLIATLVDLNLQAQAATGATLTTLRTRIDSTQRQLTDVRTQIEALGASIGSAAGQSKDPALLARLQAAAARYTSLSAEYEALKVAELRERGPATFVSSAPSDSVPVAPSPVRDGVLGLLGGMVLGLAGAVLVRGRIDIVQSVEEAGRIYGAPALGSIPAEYLRPDERRGLTVLERPASRAAEAYRQLRESLEFLNFEHEIQTLVVVAAAPGDGKSTVAANLAAGLAMAGSKVVLVNGDFNRPSTDRFFDVSNSIGLFDVLVGRMPLGVALQATSDSRLQVLTCGKLPPNPAAMLGSKTMAQLIGALEATHDWVIVDSPPVLSVADAASTVRWSDGVLVVTRSGVSECLVAAHARDILTSVGARTIGVVGWGMDADDGRPRTEPPLPPEGQSLEQITGEFVMPKDRDPRRFPAWLTHWPTTWLAGWPAKWQSGWRLALLIVAFVLIVAAAVVLTGSFGTSGLLQR